MKLKISAVSFIGFGILVVLTAVFAFTGCIHKASEKIYYRVPNDYTSTVKTGGEIEAEYLKMGPYEVVNYGEEAEFPADWSDIYYPKEMEEPLDEEAEVTGSGEGKTYPVVIFVNGTGIASYRYPALFEHMASWGFIAVGNDDWMTRDGWSVDETMKSIIDLNENADSVFYHRIDLDNIGITGHSQGGAGLINSITVGEYASMYKCASLLSPVGKSLSEELVDFDWNYDETLINIPVLIFTGTKGSFENEVVIPTEDLYTLYENIDAPKVMAQKDGYTHRESHYVSDGYVTAWFRWHLMGDTEAEKAFVDTESTDYAEGRSYAEGELMSNELYINRQMNLNGDFALTVK